MLGRIGKRQDQDKLPPEDRGHQEAAPEGIGNEALGHYLANDFNVLDHVSNEATDEEQGSQDAGKAVGTVLTLIDNIAENDPQAASEIEEKADHFLAV